MATAPRQQIREAAEAEMVEVRMIEAGRLKRGGGEEGTEPGWQSQGTVVMITVTTATMTAKAPQQEPWLPEKRHNQVR